MAKSSGINKLKSDFKKLRISQDIVAKATGINKVMQGKIYRGEKASPDAIKKLREYRDEQKKKLEKELAAI